MARFNFGGEVTHVVVAPIDADGQPYDGALALTTTGTVDFYDAEGGAAVTDFLVWDVGTGTFVVATAVPVTAGGTLPKFQGPDGLDVLWMQGLDGSWLRLRSWDFTGTPIVDADDIADGSTNVMMTAVERDKLDNIEAGATANSTDEELRDRSTHTGTDPISAQPGGSLMVIYSQVSTGYWPATYNADGTVATYGASQTAGVRSTARDDIGILWVQVVPGGGFPPGVPSGTAGMLQGKDFRGKVS